MLRKAVEGEDYLYLRRLFPKYRYDRETQTIEMVLPGLGLSPVEWGRNHERTKKLTDAYPSIDIACYTDHTVGINHNKDGDNKYQSFCLIYTIFSKPKSYLIVEEQKIDTEDTCRVIIDRKQWMISAYKRPFVVASSLDEAIKYSIIASKI